MSKIFARARKVILRKIGQRSGRETPNVKERLQELYFQLGTDYYVAARFAFFARIIPTMGTLFHHAIEMYLKGYLTRTMAEKERKTVGHDLKRAWKEFKKAVRDPKLDRFTTVIATLQKFESIRYPEKTVILGSEVGVSLKGPPPKTLRGNIPSVPKYSLVVSEIDELVAAIVKNSSINLRFLEATLSAEGITYLKKDNEFWN